MKKKFLISMVSASLLIIPTSMRADDNDTKGKSDKVAEANRKTHEKVCQGHHGTVTAKTDQTVTIDGKMYALTADTRVNKQEEPILLKTVKVGDTVCFKTEKAADGSQQISGLIAIDKDEKVRVREKDSDSPSKEVETPSKNEVK
jgi:co-chaperonin GroES (HSP10)